jgi:KDO2-lipid IV(A) lauroyltransferase
MNSIAPVSAGASRWKHKPLRGLWRRSLFLGARWLLRRSGFAGARRLGSWLGALHYRLGRRTRRRCAAGLAALLGRDRADAVVAATLREAYRVNSIAVLEVLSMIDQQLDARQLRRSCRVDGMAHLEAARRGRGAILLATHSGNSLLLAAQLAATGWPISVVYRHTRMMTREFFEQGLPRYGVEGILANEGFRAYARMLDALRRNRVLFAMMDQGVEKAETGLPVRFLGKHMPMPGGVAQLARQSRAPILPIVTLAAEPVWHFEIGPRLHLPPGGTLEDDTVAILGHTESAIRARPQLWSWPHRRWRNFPLAEPA